MKKITALLAAMIMAFSASALLGSCGNVEKNITVVVREQGSGTREAFDKTVTDGEHFLEEKDADGKKVYNTVRTAIQQTKTGTVMSTVASDRNAIGYISLGSVDDSVKVVTIDGVEPSEESVLSGEYKIQRPFVIMTKSGQTLNPVTADFLEYLKSEASYEHSAAAGCIFVRDESIRANEGRAPIGITEYEKKESLPDGGKIVVRGSTSMEKFINSAAKGYAALYGIGAEEIFDIQLEGSSVGRKAVENDSVGNVIGLSSAAVDQDNIDSFNVCLDAVAVVVNRENRETADLTLEQLYGIFSGSIVKFSDID